MGTGGDIAYANAVSACYRCWDNFLDDWESHMVTPDGFMIPLLSAIGNHDSGTNHAAQVYDAEGSGSSGPWVGDEDPRLPPMLRLFPHETPPRPPSQRRTYHHHHAAQGSISFVVLDSGYVASVDGAQRAWLAEALTPRPAHSNASWSFAAYHVPLYASTGVWQSDDDNAEYVAARESWVPLFDAARLDAAFEHHVHSLKRTRPMRASTADADGTTYLGDGQWGLSEPYGVPEQAELNRPGEGEIARAQANLATAKIARHVWEVRVGAGVGGKSSAVAISPQGEQLDAALL